jgi:hypothetical protein
VVGRAISGRAGSSSSLRQPRPHCNSNPQEKPPSRCVLPLATIRAGSARAAAATFGIFSTEAGVIRAGVARFADSRDRGADMVGGTRPLRTFARRPPVRIVSSFVMACVVRLSPSGIMQLMKRISAVFQVQVDKKRQFRDELSRFRKRIDARGCGHFWNLRNGSQSNRGEFRDEMSRFHHGFWKRARRRPQEFRNGLRGLQNPCRPAVDQPSSCASPRCGSRCPQREDVPTRAGRAVFRQEGGYEGPLARCPARAAQSENRRKKLSSLQPTDPSHNPYMNCVSTAIFRVPPQSLSRSTFPKAPKIAFFATQKR